MHQVTDIVAGDLPSSEKTTIGHRSRQILNLLEEIQTQDKALAGKGKWVKDLYAKALLQHEAADGYEVLLISAGLLPDEERAAYLELVENIKSHSTKVEFATILLKLFGVKQAWSELGLPSLLSSQANWSQAWSLTQAAGTHRKKSIFWLKPDAAERKLIKPSRVFTNDQLAALTAVRAQVFVAAGMRFTHEEVSLPTMSTETSIDEFALWAASNHEK